MYTTQDNKNIRPIGTVEMRFYDLDGNLIHHDPPTFNSVLDVGVQGLWQRITTIDDVKNFQFDTIMLGDDYGNPSVWSVFNPEPPNREFTGANQNVTYTIPSVSYTFPSDDSLRVSAEIDGSIMMDESFPTDVEYRFASMTLRYNNGTAFAFKRFPMRSLSRFVRVVIDWRFIFINAPEWCAPNEE